MTYSGKRVRFVFRRSARTLGSIQMRAFQMCRLAQAHLGQRHNFDTIGIPRFETHEDEMNWINSRRKGTVFVFIKGAIDVLSDEGRAALAERSAGIVVDYVDQRLSKMVPKDVDVHISASYAGLRAMQDKLRQNPEIHGEAHLLLHNVDERLYDMKARSANDLRTLYFGSPALTRITDRIAPHVDVFDASNAPAMEENHRKIEDYNMHYCVRETVDDRGGEPFYKPFTKGFTAAVCGANVVTHADVDDALEFLGGEYPYLARSNSEEDVLEQLIKARATFGKKEWNKANRIMSGVAQRISPTNIALQLDMALSQF